MGLFGTTTRTKHGPVLRSCEDIYLHTGAPPSNLRTIPNLNWLVSLYPMFFWLILWYLIEQVSCLLTCHAVRIYYSPANDLTWSWRTIHFLVSL